MAMRPKVSRAGGKLLLSYDLHHRVYCSAVYPIASPNGSTILIYGHELGIGVIWRGGRPFKATGQSQKTKSNTNGTSNEAIMIIDSDDDDSPAEISVCQDEHDFEEKENELDPSDPFYNVFRRTNLPLGTTALEIAVPAAACEVSKSSSLLSPSILSSKIVFAVLCSDCKTRVISLPLVPPYQDSQRGTIGYSGEEILEISSSATRQVTIGKIAITFTLQSHREDSRRGSGQHQAIPMETSTEDSPRLNSSQSRGRASASNSKSRGGEEWQLLMATHSHESLGPVLIYRIPILEESTMSGTNFRFSNDHTKPVQSLFLRTQPTSLSFNPSPYPSERHSHLLISNLHGTVKIFSCAPPKARSSRNRRASILDPELDREADGKWLVSLFPGFSTSLSSISRRKAVTTANWVLGGKSIMVLLADGEWGIWDLEGAGPGASQSLVRGQSNVQGVTGGALTSFAISGWIAASETKSSAASAPDSAKPKLAPMTPGTRKIREDLLFKQPPAPHPTTSTSTSFFVNGSISVSPHPFGSSDGDPDESIVLQHANQTVIIPSLLSYWRSKVKKLGTFDSSTRFRPFPLDGVALPGEHLLDVSQFPVNAPSAYTASFPPATPRYPDVLLTTEYRLLILVAPLVPTPKQQGHTGGAKELELKPDDQALLNRGQLNVEGMDRILDGMANGTMRSRKASPSKRRRVGFA